jgi:hypothetical protein
MTLGSFKPFFTKEPKSEPGEIFEKALEQSCETSKFCPVRDGTYRWTCYSHEDVECSNCRKNYFINMAKKQGVPE